MVVKKLEDIIGADLVNLTSDIAWSVNQFPSLTSEETIMIVANYPFKPEDPEKVDQEPTGFILKKLGAKANVLDLKDKKTMSRRWKINKKLTKNTRTLLGNEPESNKTIEMSQISMKVKGYDLKKLVDLLKAETSKVKRGETGKTVISKAKVWSVLEPNVQKYAEELAVERKAKSDEKAKKETEKGKTGRSVPASAPAPVPATPEAKPIVKAGKRK